MRPVTNPERQEEIRRFGYGVEEAAFLCLVALHGGYFLSRQFPDFVGKQRGRCVTKLIEKTVALGHCRTHVYRHNRCVYHLFSKPFYRAIGEEDNRNRRERRVFTIKNKLMGLDLVLANRQRRFLATEQEKIEYFEGELGIERSLFPTRRYQSRSKQTATDRYFVDKFPLFLAQSENSRTDVTFTFIDEDVVTGTGFETYLRQYAALFKRLGDCSLMYVGSQGALFEEAQRTFGSFFGSSALRNRVPADPNLARIAAHFRERQLFESREFRTFNQDRLIRFRADRQEFSGERFDALFAAWKQVGEAALDPELGGRTGSQNAAVPTFRRYMLPFDYNIFGSVQRAK